MTTSDSGPHATAQAAGLPVPTISVVVTTHGRPEGFARVTGAVANQILECRLADSVGLVVVFDGHDPYDTEGLDALGVHVIALTHSERSGIARARNSALAACDSDLVVFIDDDAQPEPRWLANLLRGVAAYPELSCFGGRVRRMPDNDKLLPRLRDDIYYRETFGHWYLADDGPTDATPIDQPGPPYVNGGNCAYRTGVFAEFGDFRPDLPAYVDVEFGLRVGCPDTGVLLDGFSIAHQHPDRLRSYLRRCFTSGQARARLRPTYPQHARRHVAAGIGRNLATGNLTRIRRLPAQRLRAYGTLTLQELTHAAGYLYG